MLRPDPESGELCLAGLYPGVSVPQVQEKTGWHLAVSPDLVEIPAPAEAELTALRALLSAAPSAAVPLVAPDGADSAARRPVSEGVLS
jgi:hypothetical protein